MLNLDYPNKKTVEEIERLIDKKRLKEVPIKKSSEIGIFIHGDNLDGMIALLNEFESKIDLVYIDPPFNTFITAMRIHQQSATLRKI